MPEQAATVEVSGTQCPGVLYARVSSKEQEQGYSIAAQQELLRPYASQIGVVIAREFLDVESAKTTGRPGFAAMIAYLKAHPECRVVLVEKTDRLYRNFKDYLTIDELGVEVHLVKENEVLRKDSRASQKFMHGIRVLMAKNYIDNLREEVQKGLHTKAAQGLYPSFAPLGYCNTVGPEGRRIIVPDPVLGPMVTSLFSWFATGEYSLKALAKKAYQEGFRFRKTSNKVPITTLHKILRKRIYTGAFDYAGATYQGTHEPLVEGAIWERVQEILEGRQQKKHRKLTHDFAFSGLVSCGHCGCSLVGEIKKARYVYYHCTGYRGKCAEPYTREETLARQFAASLHELIIPGPVLEWLQAELVASDLTERAAREQAQRRDQAEWERLQRRLEVLYEDRLDRRIEASMYDQKAGEIRQQQDQLRRRISERQGTQLPPASHVVDLVALTSKAAELFLEQPRAEQRKLLRLVLDTATWTQRLVKTGGRLIKHARYYWLLLAESHLTRRLFGAMVGRIEALPGAPGPGGIAADAVGSKEGWKQAGEAVRCLKKSPPGGSFRAPGALGDGRGTPYRPCRDAVVPENSRKLMWSLTRGGDGRTFALNRIRKWKFRVE